MNRSTFFKTLALGFAGLATAKLTPVEAAAAQEIPVPKPVVGSRAYVTTVKGSRARIKHSLGSSVVFVLAASLKNRTVVPKVDVVDKDTVDLRFEQPGVFAFMRPHGVYKVVVSAGAFRLLPEHREFPNFKKA